MPLILLPKWKGTEIVVTGIILINVERSKIKTVTDELLNIDRITEVYTVAGEYDLVAIARVKDNHQLSEIIVERMSHQIDGIKHTKTLIALNSFSNFDLEKIFLSS